MRSLAVCVSCAVVLAIAWLVLRLGPVGVPVVALIPMMLVIASILLPRLLLVCILAVSLVALVLMHVDTSGLAPIADPVIFGAICLVATGVGLALRGFLIEPPHPGAAAPGIDQEVSANGHANRHPYVSASTQVPESALDQQMARLSRRERDVVRLVLEGRSTRQIGSALFISERTVETHLANIYNKIDVHSRSELVNRLLDRMQIPPLP